MIVLGVDPSFTCTGYAVMQQQASKQFLIHQATLKLSPSQPMQNRIGHFHTFFQQVIEHYQISRIAIETPFLGKNAATFLKLGYLRGILHLLAHQHAIEIVEFAPSEIKKALTGYAFADKQQISYMIHMLFPQLVQQKSYDVTDAIAISLCGLWKLPQAT